MEKNGVSSVRKKVKNFLYEVLKIFFKAKEIAGITKKVTIRTLKHAFATHLLDAGYDIRYVQKLLGYKSIKTIHIYTYVSNKVLMKIKKTFG